VSPPAQWFIRSIGAPQTETLINLYHSFVAAVTCSLPPWTVEAREAAAEEAEQEEDGEHEDAAPDKSGDKEDGAGSEKASTSSSVRSARALGRYKRFVVTLGVVGTYFCWAIFSW
jgi:hypothetical protein